MKHGTRRLNSTSALVIMVGAIFFAGKPQPSSAQNDGFVLYQLNVHCGSSSLVTKIFTHENKEGGTEGRPLMGTKVICAGKKCLEGTVTLAAALAQLPAGASTALQAQVDIYQQSLPAGEDWFLTCLGENKKRPELECEKPTPWFGTPSKCKDIQNPVIAVQGMYATVAMCGFRVWRGSLEPEKIDDAEYVTNYKAALIQNIKARVGSKVCCDKFRAAAGSGSDCNPRADIDCDGIPNTKDFSQGFPDLGTLFTIPDGASIDPFPDGLNPDDVGFLPPQDECACKWLLLRGRLNCSPDGKQDHFYEADWECPSTRNVRKTRKNAPATAKCEPTRTARNFSELVFLPEREPMFPLTGIL